MIQFRVNMASTVRNGMDASDMPYHIGILSVSLVDVGKTHGGQFGYRFSESACPATIEPSFHLERQHTKITSVANERKDLPKRDVYSRPQDATSRCYNAHLRSRLYAMTLA